MKCEKCGKEMKEEIIFTSVNYSCNCLDDGWQTVEEMLNFLTPMDLPIKLKYLDADGCTGNIFIGDLDYFSRCPKGRKFKVTKLYDPYIGLKKGMTIEQVAEALYGYPLTSTEDDGC